MNKRLLFLASGGGGNLRFLQQVGSRGLMPGWHLAGVISDRTCRALEDGRKAGWPARQIDYRQETPGDLIQALRELEPDLILTTFHRILSKEVLDSFPDKFLNLHYSSLPAYGGLIGAEPVRRALADGLTETGVTVHRVTEIVDGGPVVARGAVPLVPGEPLDGALNRVFRTGCLTLLNSLWILAGKTGTPTPSVGFTPPLRYDASLLSERFWESVR